MPLCHMRLRGLLQFKVYYIFTIPPYPPPTPDFCIQMLRQIRHQRPIWVEGALGGLEIISRGVIGNKKNFKPYAISSPNPELGKDTLKSNFYEVQSVNAFKKAYTMKAFTKAYSINAFQIVALQYSIVHYFFNTSVKHKCFEAVAE